MTMSKERARYLVLRTLYKDKVVQVVLRVIFWYEPGDKLWCGRAIEAENIFTCTEDESKLEWMMADAAMTMIEFVLKSGGSLKKLLRRPRKKELEHWIALRERENLPVDIDRCSLRFADLYPEKTRSFSRAYTSQLSYPQAYAQF